MTISIEEQFGLLFGKRVELLYYEYLQLSQRATEEISQKGLYQSLLGSSKQVEQQRRVHYGHLRHLLDAPHTLRHN